MALRERELFALASQAAGTYYSPMQYAGNLDFGALFIKVPTIAAGGTLAITVEATDVENPASTDWHDALVLSTISTTGNKDMITITNLGKLYRIKAVVAVNNITFSVVAIEQPKI